MKIVKSFKLKIAHFLPGYVGKCKQLHGHTMRLDVVVDGHINPDTGMIIDFHEIDRIVKNNIWSVLDHTCLNDTIQNPTSENVAVWIMGRLKKELPGTVSIRLWEDDDAYVELSAGEHPGTKGGEHR